MRIERIDVAQNLPCLFKLLAIEHLAAHHETHRTARVHRVAADASAHIFMARNGAQHFAGHGVRDIAREHFVADHFQVVVNALQRIGRVFGIGIEQLEQHFLGVFN